jgi:hypothetical protein
LNIDIIPYKWVEDCYEAADFLDYAAYKYRPKAPLADLFKDYTFQVMPSAHFKDSDIITS